MDLKNLSEEDKQKVLTEVNTQVTSLAEEEKRTGQQIVLPDAEKLAIQASLSLVKNRKKAVQILGQMSKKQILRSISAMLDLPQDGLPVYLKTEEEKLLFAVGQRAISDRYIVLTHAINKQIMEDRLKQKQEKEVTNE